MEMTKKQEKMADKLIQKYGYEHHMVINFIWMCEHGYMDESHMRIIQNTVITKEWIKE